MPAIVVAQFISDWQFITIAIAILNLHPQSPSSNIRSVSVALYAELHRHLGGSVVPRILWRYFQRHHDEFAQRFPQYSEFATPSP